MERKRYQNSYFIFQFQCKFFSAVRREREIKRCLLAWLTDIGYCFFSCLVLGKIQKICSFFSFTHSFYKPLLSLSASSVLSKFFSSFTLAKSAYSSIRINSEIAKACGVLCPHFCLAKHHFSVLFYITLLLFLLHLTSTSNRSHKYFAICFYCRCCNYEMENMRCCVVWHREWNVILLI